MLRFGEKVVLFIFRPIYRTFFERLVWWFLTKVKIFFMADLNVQLEASERRIREENQQRWGLVEEQMRRIEANNAAQWDGLEKLLLAMFRQPTGQEENYSYDPSTVPEPPRAREASNTH
jgi:hypothetical protein